MPLIDSIYTGQSNLHPIDLGDLKLLWSFETLLLGRHSPALTTTVWAFEPVASLVPHPNYPWTTAKTLHLTGSSPNLHANSILPPRNEYIAQLDCRHQVPLPRMSLFRELNSWCPKHTPPCPFTQIMLKLMLHYLEDCCRQFANLKLL